MGHEDWPSRKFPMFCLVWLLICLAWALERPTTPKHQWSQTKKCEEKCPFSRQRTKGSAAKQKHFDHTCSTEKQQNVVPPFLFSPDTAAQKLWAVCLPTLLCINEAILSLNPLGCSCGECGWSFMFQLYSGIAKVELQSQHNHIVESELQWGGSYRNKSSKYAYEILDIPLSDPRVKVTRNNIANSFRTEHWSGTTPRFQVGLLVAYK